MDISVVIATRNRPARLGESLRAIGMQDSDGVSWEVVVVNNGASEDTPGIIRSNDSKMSMTVLHEPVPGKNRALNRALGVARGELIVFTDDDVMPARDWLRQLWNGARRWSNDAVFGGSIDPRFPEGTPPWLTSSEFKYGAIAFARYHPQSFEGPSNVTPFGPNCAVRRRVFSKFRFAEDVGPAGVNYAMGSETELFGRLRANGMRSIFIPSACVAHVIGPEQITAGYLVGRAFRGGRGAVRCGMVDWQSPRLADVPRYLWRRAFEKWFIQYCQLARGRRAFLEARMDLWYTLGMIREYRNASRSDRVLPTPAELTAGDHSSQSPPAHPFGH